MTYPRSHSGHTRTRRLCAERGPQWREAYEAGASIQTIHCQEAARGNGISPEKIRAAIVDAGGSIRSQAETIAITPSGNRYTAEALEKRRAAL
jgi:hypothetical protein